MRIPLPTAPAGAQYALFILNLMDAQRNDATMDFVQLPLDAALRPNLAPMGFMGSSLRLGLPAVQGRMYRLQSKSDLNARSWAEVEDLMADGDSAMFMVPVSGAQSVYQVILLPE